MENIRATAKQRMNGVCRLCPVCDGRVCAGEVPGMGGIGSGSSFKNNVSALSRLTLNMSLIHEVKSPSTSASWLGLNLDTPVVASPIGGVFNFKDAVGEDTYIADVLQGCLDAGSIGCSGDGPAAAIFEASLKALAEVNGRGIPFIKPWESSELDEKTDLALAAGCSVLGMDIDAAGLTTLRKMGKPVAPKSVAELSRTARAIQSRGAKFVIKGIMTPADALAAVEAGADGIVVSNHGGRVLDCTPGTADVLSGIAEAVKGRIAVMVDGGVRNGLDVFKMLALGADIVGIGRPVSVAAIGGGREGVRALFEKLRGELSQTMIMTGCADLASIGKKALHGQV